MKNGGSFHSYVNIYHRVIWPAGYHLPWTVLTKYVYYIMIRILYNDHLGIMILILFKTPFGWWLQRIILVNIQGDDNHPRTRNPALNQAGFRWKDVVSTAYLGIIWPVGKDYCWIRVLLGPPRMIEWQWMYLFTTGIYIQKLVGFATYIPSGNVLQFAIENCH